MRVLNVSYTLDAVSGGGTSERTFQMTRSLLKAGIECDVLTLDVGLTAARRGALSGAKLIALPCLSRRFYLPKLLSVWRVREAVQRADIVHLMGHWTLLNAVAYFFAKRLGKPYVVCPAGALPIYGRSKLLKHLYNRFVGRKVVRNASGHIAITADEIPHFEAYAVAGGRVTVIPNRVDPEDFRMSDGTAFRQRYDLGDHPFVLFVGRLNFIKGPDLLLQAFCQVGGELADHHLVFAGPDEGMLARLRSLAWRAGLEERVHFVGYLGGSEKSRAYHAAELLVIPSRQEAMSLVALEAGITGTPVLLTDRCGFDEVARVGGGKVVPASVKGLQEGIVELLEDPARLGLMGENLREFVQKHLTWESAAEEYLALYGRILGGTERQRLRQG